MGELASLIGEILGTLSAIKDLFGSVKEEITDIFVAGGTEVIGLADAVSEPVEISKNFLGAIFPTEFVIMVGVGFTVILAVAMRRSTNA